jgi:hypothetical protein
MSLTMTTVTCAIIENEGKVLIVRRAAGQKLVEKWEFIEFTGDSCGQVDS